MNRNGVTDSGELKSLTELGIKSIGLSAHNLDGQVKIGSNALISTAVFTRTDGTTGTVGDTALSFKSISSSALAALSVLRSPLSESMIGWNHGGDLEAAIAQMRERVIENGGPVTGQEAAQHTGQFGVEQALEDAANPAASASLADSAQQLVALMTQNMASFGTDLGHADSIRRDHEGPARFDFFA